MGIWSNVFIVVRSKLVLKTKTNWTNICLQFEIKSVNCFFLGCLRSLAPYCP